MEMFCPKCGTQNADGGGFCANCGTPLSAGAPSSPPPPQPPAGNTGYYAPQGYQQPPQTGYYPQPGYAQTSAMAPPRKSNNTMIGIIVVIVVVIILGVVAYLIFGGGFGNSLVGAWTGELYGTEVTFDFKNNGQLVISGGGTDSTGKYKVSGGKLTVTDPDGETSTGAYKIYTDGGKKALDLTFEGETLTLYKENSGGQGTAAQGGQSVVGKWEGKLDGSKVSIEFKSNGTAILTNDGEESQVKYKISGKTMTITDEDDEVSSGTFKIYKDDDKTALDMTFDDDTITLYKK